MACSQAESEQAGSGQQDEGQGNLRNDEAVAEGLCGAAGGAAARLRLQRRRRAGPAG